MLLRYLARKIRVPSLWFGSACGHGTAIHNSLKALQAFDDNGGAMAPTSSIVAIRDGSV